MNLSALSNIMKISLLSSSADAFTVHSHQTFSLLVQPPFDRHMSVNAPPRRLRRSKSPTSTLVGTAGREAKVARFSSGGDALKPMSANEWEKQLGTDEVQSIRAELVQKYLDQGRSQEYAEVEVDKFLSDQDKSAEFLEMKMYNDAQEEMGFETAVAYLAAFLFGAGFHIAANFYNSYKESIPDTGV